MGSDKMDEISEFNKKLYQIQYRNATRRINTTWESMIADHDETADNEPNSALLKLSSLSILFGIAFL